VWRGANLQRIQLTACINPLHRRIGVWVCVERSSKVDQELVTEEGE
jgi:hypothetical protein